MIGAQAVRAGLRKRTSDDRFPPDSKPFPGSEFVTENDRERSFAIAHFTSS